MAYVTITGTLVNAVDGTPHKGVGFIEPTTPVLLDTAGNKVLLEGASFALDGTGMFSVSVRATDDPALSPQNFTYRIGFRLSTGQLESFTFYAPAAVPVLDLSDITPVVADFGEPVIPVIGEGGVVVGADGDSAYQVAVNNGFVGTQAQWLASLVGPKGDKGDTGLQGIQGVKGDTGLQGIQGVQGDTGPAGPGVPTGGTTGQVLSKVDGTNYNTQWVTPSAGGGMTAVAVKSGEYIRPSGQYNNGTFSLSANTVTAVPMLIPAGTYQSVTTFVTNAGAAGSLLRLGIYDGDTLVKDYGTVASDTTGSKTITSSLTVATTKWYWAVFVHQGVTTTALSVVRVDSPSVSGVAIFTNNDMQFTPGGGLTYGTTQSGALPSTITGTRSTVNHGPAFTLRAA